MRRARDHALPGNYTSEVDILPPSKPELADFGLVVPLNMEEPEWVSVNSSVDKLDLVSCVCVVATFVDLIVVYDIERAS